MIACRMDKYKDLKLACLRHGCEQILYVPILPQLPDGRTDRAGQPKPPQSAFGVLTLGFDSSVMMDARYARKFMLSPPCTCLVAQVGNQEYNTYPWHSRCSWKGTVSK